MFRSYLIVAFRGIARNKLNSALNIIGLSLGISCFILTTIYTLSETSYNTHYTDSQQIFRVTMDLISKESGSVEQLAWSDASLGPKLKEYPEVISTASIGKLSDNAVVKIAEKQFNELSIYKAEKTYFNIFSHHWLKGSTKSALENPGSVVLTESLALKYFGRTDALNQSINIDHREYIVTGVIKDLPKNTDLIFDALVSLETRVESSFEWCYLYLKLHDGSSAAEFQAKLDDLFAKEIRPVLDESNADGNYHLEPLLGIHFGIPKLFDTPKADEKNVWLFTFIGLLVLGMSCINYINLSIAESMRKNKDVGVRKVMGAIPGQIQFQYLTSSLLIAFVSIVFAVAISIFTIPILNNLINSNIQVENLMTFGFCGILLLVLFLVGIGAGGYPAFYLSSFNFIKALNGNGAPTKTKSLKRLLIVFQFITSISLIVSSIIVRNELTLLTTEVPLFNKEKIVVIDVPDDAGNLSKVSVLKNAINQLPFVKNTSLVSQNSLPMSEMSMDTYKVRHGLSGNEAIRLINEIEVDEDYLKVLEIEMVAGRNFTPADFSQNKSVVIVNEALVSTMEWENPLSEKVSYGSSEAQVVGIVKNFNDNGLRQKVHPVLIYPSTNSPGKILIRINDLTVNNIEGVKKVWSATMQNAPMQYDFMDSYFMNQFKSELSMKVLLNYFTWLASIIACIGLYGLLALESFQRLKELAIRKIFGASFLALVKLLSKEYLVAVFIAFIISIPLILFAMNSWLQNFSYRISLSPYLFLFAFVIVITLLIVTVSYHIIKAANQNAIKSLRNE